MLRPDFSDIKRDMAEAAAARARGEKWCHKCTVRQEQGESVPCPDCLAKQTAEAHGRLAMPPSYLTPDERKQRRMNQRAARREEMRAVMAERDREIAERVRARHRESHE